MFLIGRFKQSLMTTFFVMVMIAKFQISKSKIQTNTNIQCFKFQTFQTINRRFGHWNFNH